MVLRVQVSNSASLPRIRIQQHLVNRGVSAQGEIRVVEQLRKEYFQTAVTRRSIATIVTSPTVVARGPIVVRLAKHRQRIRQHRNAKFCSPLLDEQFAAARTEGWKQFLANGCIGNFL